MKNISIVLQVFVLYVTGYEKTDHIANSKWDRSS